MSSFKGKIFAIFAVAIMLASTFCVIGCSEGTTGIDTGGIPLETKSITKSEFKNKYGGNGESYYEYKNGKGTLYLNNFEYEGTVNYVIRVSVVATIDIVGDCKITVAAHNDISCCIGSNYDLEIVGHKDSTLSLIPNNNSQNYSAGIDALSGKLTISGLNLSIECSGTNLMYGICANDSLNITNSNVTIKNNSTSNTSMGIFNKNGNTSITDSTVDMSLSDAPQIIGLSSESGNIEVTGEKTKVVIRTGAASSNIYGIKGVSVNVNKSIIDIELGKNNGTGLLNNIAVQATNISVSNAILKLKTGTIANTAGMSNCKCINATGSNLSISKSTISAESGEITGNSSKISIGICGNITLNDCSVTKISGYASCVDSNVKVDKSTLDILRGSTSIESPSYEKATTPLSKYKILRTEEVILTIDNGVDPSTTEGRVKGEMFPAPECTATKPGLEFAGWTPDKGATVYKTGDIVTMPSADMTLTAIWEVPKVTVTFKSGTTEVSDPDPQEVEKGKTATEPSISWTGHTLLGWYDSDDVKWDFNDPVNEDITLTAKWEVIIVTVTFKSGTTEVSDPDPQEVEEGKTATEPSISWTGHTLLGWYDSNDVKWDFSNPVNTDITLTAKWEVTKYTVTFKSGTTEVSDPPEQTIEYGKAATEPSITWAGHKLLGWYDSNDVKWDFSNPVNADITLTAHWETIIYVTVNFNCDGGSSVESMTIEAGTTITEPITTKAGFIFKGWFTDDNLLYDFSNAFVENTDLMAKWVMNASEVEVVADGAGNVEVLIPTDATVTVLAIRNGDMTVTLESESIELIRQDGRSLYISIKPLNGQNSFLVTMKLGTDDFTGLREIQLPFDPLTGTDPVVYIKEGTSETKVDSTYDKSAGVINLTIDHGSTYVVKYTDPVPEPEPEPEHKKSFWDETGNMVGVIILILLILALILLAVYDRTRRA